MSEARKAGDFIAGFENLSEDEQKEAIKNLMPKFCQIAMKDKSIIEGIIPECMEMVKGMDFPMREMMSKMMGKA